LCAYSIVEQQWSYNCRMEELFGLANWDKHTHTISLSLSLSLYIYIYVGLYVCIYTSVGLVYRPVPGIITTGSNTSLIPVLVWCRDLRW
jgi:hypothetical protein